MDALTDRLTTLAAVALFGHRTKKPRGGGDARGRDVGAGSEESVRFTPPRILRGHHGARKKHYFSPIEFFKDLMAILVRHYINRLLRHFD